MSAILIEGGCVMEKSRLLNVVLLVTVLMVGFGYLNANNANNALMEENGKLKIQYNNLNATYYQLLNSYHVLDFSYQQLTQTYNDLRQNYSILRADHDKLEDDYTGLLGDYKVIYDSRYEEGYDIGYIKGITDGAGRGYTVRDPAYQEALQFVSSDPTDKNQYVPKRYTCTNFAADFKNNAFKVGYRCGFVLIEFPDSAHAIVCFNTTDYGIIFIEPQNDEITKLVIGQPYWDRTKYQKPEFDDTILRFIIVW